MWRLTLVLALMGALLSCRSHKQAVASTAERTDSAMVGSAVRELAFSDSLSRRVAFSFDSLMIAVAAPSPAMGNEDVPVATERRVLVYGGRLDSNTQARRTEQAREQQADSSAVHRARESEQLTQNAVTAIADPPDMTLLWIGLLILFVLVLRFRRVNNS